MLPTVYFCGSFQCNSWVTKHGWGFRFWKNKCVSGWSLVHLHCWQSWGEETEAMRQNWRLEDCWYKAITPRCDGALWNKWKRHTCNPLVDWDAQIIEMSLHSHSMPLGKACKMPETPDKTRQTASSMFHRNNNDLFQCIVSYRTLTTYTKFPIIISLNEHANLIQCHSK